jgi:hypothetical protein
MRLFTSFLLLTISFLAAGQASPKRDDKLSKIDTLFSKHDAVDKPVTSFSYVHIDKEIRYTDPNGKSIIIQNSLPKGGIGFNDTLGNTFGKRVFWSRIINESNTPLELTINFPADSFPVALPDAYLKVFLPPDTLVPYKEALHDYGAKDLKSFYNSVRRTATSLHKTINPHEACVFYIVVLRHGGRGGTPRGGLALKGEKLFYRIDPEFGPALIPCGKLVFND